MKAGKRFLSLALVFLMCLSLLPMGALASEEGMSEEIEEPEVAEISEEPAEETESLNDLYAAEEPADEEESSEAEAAEVEEPAEEETQEPVQEAEEPTGDDEMAAAQEEEAELSAEVKEAAQEEPVDSETDAVELDGSTYILNASNVSGSDYASSAALAKKLDNIFNGTVSLFSNTSNTYKLGTSINTSYEYVVANYYSGYQCYIYAQAVYYYLFGDVPYQGNGSAYWKNSTVVISNQATASYELFKNAGVGVGAYLRTTSNANGSYNGCSGHSLIVLSYDSTYITYLEGNADGYGLVRVTKQTWSEFNSALVSGQGRRIAHVIQLKDYSTIGETAGGTYLSKCTLYPCYRTVKITSATTLKTFPCSASTDSTSKNVRTPSIGETFTATGLYKNTAGNYWYRVTDGSTTCYLSASDASTVEVLYKDVTISGVSAPTSLTVGSRFSIKGDVKSTYNTITTVYGYVYPGSATSGTASCSGSATVNGKSYTLLNGAIDMALTFNTLSVGSYNYVVTAKVQNYYSPNGTSLSSNTNTITLVTQGFSVVKSGTTTYTVTFNANGGSCSTTSATVTSGGKLVSLPTPTRNGYAFSGWYTAVSGGTKVTTSTAITSNMTLYAHWVSTTATITFSQDNVSVECNASTTVKVTCGGNLPDEYYLNFNVVDGDIVVGKWGDWNGATCPLTITGLREGSTTIIISLRDSSTDELVASEGISVTVPAVVKVTTGWQQKNGKWYYYDSTGSAVTGEKKLSGKWYYFDANGVMQTGWKQWAGKWYYYDLKSGAMRQSAWLSAGGNWYYFDSNGAMATGWRQIGGTWYYFASSGAMTTGWKQLSGKWYYFDLKSGAMRQSAWLKAGGNWYYFDSNGAMLASTTRKIDGTTYTFDANGRML